MSNSDSASAVARLDRGLATIDPLLAARGFRLSAREAGKGSGGPFASAEFANGDRSIRIWLRHVSISVHYRLEDQELTHGDYMRQLLGPGGGNKFPTFSGDVTLAFDAFRHDLESHCQDFLEGDGSEFRRCWHSVQEEYELTGTQRLARIEREIRPSG